MKFANSWARWLIVVLALTTGCNGKTTTSTGGSGEDGGVASDSTGSKSKKNIVPVKRNVKEVLGNWVIVMTNQRTDNYRWIINFSRGADGKIVGELVDSNSDKEEKDKFELVETEVNGDAVHLAFKNSKVGMDFVGTFQQGFIRGTMRLSPFELYLTRLLPTDEKSLEQFGATGLPPGSDVFEAKMKSKDFQPDDFLNTIREYRTSPLAQDMYAMLMKEHVRAKFDEAKLKELIDAYESSSKIWGVRWEARTEITIAVSLINGRQFARLALSHFDAAEKEFGDDLATFQPTIDEFRTSANIVVRVQELENPSSTDKIRATANVELIELLKKQRFNSEILFALATQAERTGNVDATIEYLSDIVALPLLEGTIVALRAGLPPDTPTPSEHLKKLWVEKHGNDEEFEKHISDVHRERIHAFLAEIQKNGAPATAETGNRTVLIELFTGMMCPPCVGADLALSAIGMTYPTSKVIVLRYHQHIPKPDGLVNQDSEERGAFYELSSTPSIVIDGIPIISRFYAGPIQVAPAGYAAIRSVVDARLSEKTEIVLQLSAAVTDGQLAIAVEATGIPEDVQASCRLRMAIAENEVVTDGPRTSMTNGIRIHEFVVREMPGGAKGIPPKKGELKYSTTMPVAELQQHVVEFIERFEAGRRGEFPAEFKPPITGPLSLVAWVQNSNPDPELRAKIVLQSAIVPITGDTGFEMQAVPAANTEPMPARPEKPSEEPKPKTSADVAKSSSESTPPPPELPE